MNNKSATPELGGTITALITPFYRQKIDYTSLKNLVRHQLDAGVKGFVINGTTAESPTLIGDEVASIFKFVKKMVDPKFLLILGTGSNSTADTILKTQLAIKLKAAAALVVVPYYNKPPQRGLVAHFKKIAQEVRVPIVLYNVPSRTITSLSLESILVLSKTKNIVGIKEASGDLDFFKKLKPATPNHFRLLSGDDTTAIQFALGGGHGVISVISHVIPQEFTSLISRATKGDRTTVQEYNRYARLNKYLALESNPIPVKKTLQMMGIIRSAEMRLPLVELSADYSKLIEAELIKLELI